MAILSRTLTACQLGSGELEWNEQMSSWHTAARENWWLSYGWVDKDVMLQNLLRRYQEFATITKSLCNLKVVQVVNFWSSCNTLVSIDSKICNIFVPCCWHPNTLISSEFTPRPSSETVKKNCSDPIEKKDIADSCDSTFLQATILGGRTEFW